MNDDSNPAIGGYFGLEIQDGREYHDCALRLNTGRSALEFALMSMEGKPGTVHLPAYICDAVLEPLNRLGIASRYYAIDERLAPIVPHGLTEADAVIWVNYFGIMPEGAGSFSNIPARLVVDNSQAFFSAPTPGADTFYSARKFFGVPDGAYLYSERRSGADLERDVSYDRAAHLLQRADISAEKGYADFIGNEARLSGCAVRGMSRLTQRLLASIDYDAARARRDENFLYLHRHLEGRNELPISESAVSGPMVYPLLIRDGGLREKLRNRRIYCPTYWPEVFARAEGTVEYDLAKHLLPLPIDQRYERSHMDRILETLDE